MIASRRSPACFSIDRIPVWTTTLLLLAIALAARAAEFRISFLEQPPILQETCALLESNGFPREATTTFRRLVEWQNYGGNGVDTNKFSPREKGAYRFESMRDFTNRVSHPFADASGKPTFMCFDAAFLLLHAAGVRAEAVDEDFESKDFIIVTPERAQSPMSKEVLLGATNLLCPPEGYRGLVGRPRPDAERKLGISLHGARRLRPEITDSDNGLRAAFADFLASVKRDGLVFPTKFKAGLVFYVDVKRKFLKTDHAFICIPKQGHLIILEKDNSPGPYVRGDFASEADLAEYVSFAERRDTNNPQDVDYGSSVMVSLNERLIGTFRPLPHR